MVTFPDTFPISPMGYKIGNCVPDPTLIPPPAVGKGGGGIGIWYVSIFCIVLNASLIFFKDLFLFIVASVSGCLADILGHLQTFCQYLGTNESSNLPPFQRIAHQY